jgi:hypothetical protein
MKDNWFTVILMMAVFIMGVILLRTCNNPTQGDMIIQLQDSLVKTKNKLEQETASKMVIVGDYNKLLSLAGRSNDSLLNLLKSSLRKNTLSSTAVKTKTHERTTTATRIVHIKRPDGKPNTLQLDTNVRTSEGIMETLDGADTTTEGTIESDVDTVSDSLTFPVYTTTYQDEWRTYAITATQDSITLDYTGINMFDVKQEWQTQAKGIKGWFKPKVLQVSITNLNPHTETVGLQSFHATEKKGTWQKGFITGAVIGIIGGFILFK